MKARSWFLIVLATAALSALNIWMDRDRLPERVASHFNLQGHADGWMTRDGAVGLMAVAVFVVPLIIFSAFNIARVAPLSSVNLPNKQYWFAEERREKSLRFLAESGAYCAILMVMFFSLLHNFVIEANSLHPPHLAPRPLWYLTGVFVLGELLGILRVISRFSKRPAH